MSACLDCGGSECICRSITREKLLIKALQIFTQAIGGEEGYIPSLGAPKTREALELMRKANVKPVWHYMNAEKG